MLNIFKSRDPHYAVSFHRIIYISIKGLLHLLYMGPDVLLDFVFMKEVKYKIIVQVLDSLVSDKFRNCSRFNPITESSNELKWRPVYSHTEAWREHRGFCVFRNKFKSNFHIIKSRKRCTQSLSLSIWYKIKMWYQPTGSRSCTRFALEVRKDEVTEILFSFFL